MNTLAITSVIIAIISSLIIAIDLIRHRQKMHIMHSVWILTGLWAGILALIVYFWFGRQRVAAKDAMRVMSTKVDAPMDGMKMDVRPKWQSTTISTLHCGAGCTLADLIGEWVTYLIIIKIGSSVILGSMIFDYVLALIIGVYFQYAAIKGMVSMSRGATLKAAFKADVMSLTAWQIGMYGFMAIVYFVIFKDSELSKASWIFWFMMQIAMLVGFFVSYPVNVILIKLKIKRAM